MLNISKNNDSFLLCENPSFKGTILVKPLHKIFLKNYLKGSFNHSLDCWYLPNGTVDNLIIILNHFKKYEIQIDYDKECELLLEKKSKGDEEFKKLLINALECKKQINEKAINEIKQFLSPEFSRQLTLNQYQAVNHLLSIQNGANFSVPGSGKTTIALAYYQILKKLKVVERLFIIGPASVFEPWETEYIYCYNKNAPSVRIAGNQRSIRKSLYLTVEKNEIFLNTYHSSARDIQEVKALLQQRKFLLILDESHYVKKPTGGKLADAILELTKYAKRKLILSGTPMPNGLADLWSQISFLWIDRLPLGTTNQYLSKISNTEDEKVFNSVKLKIDPFFFRITKSQLGLPIPNFHFRKYKLSPLQAMIYKGVAAKFLTELDISNKDKLILRELRRARSIRLLQIASNPALLRANCVEFLVPPYDAKGLDISDVINNYSNLEIPNKIQVVANLTDELIGKGEKVIIWSMFVHNLFMLEKLLNRYNPVVIYGGIPYTKDDEVEISRELLIHKFKTENYCNLLIANPAACAESISLHKVCHNAIYLDRSFNCAHYLQSLDRIHRLGLKEDDIINYYIMVSDGTIDEVVDSRLNQKINNLNYMLEGELPGNLPGYWNNDLGEEEDVDYNLVDNHIRQLFSKDGNKAN